MSVALLLKMDVKLKISYQTYYVHNYEVPILEVPIPFWKKQTNKQTKQNKIKKQNKNANYADLIVKWNSFILGV